ncbi:RteC domain-containing protein [Dysgonomonas sp. GY617]|nr:RteC domain-containing protein [Dysgonomonas sp. GY617]
MGTSRGKNALKLAYIQKALALANSERELLNLKIRHPEQFHQFDQPTFESELYIIPKSKDLGIVALAEIIVALFLSKKVFQRNGKPAHLNQIADVFQKIFNCSFGSIYDQQEKVFDRKPFNRTKALDFLKNLIIRKDKEGINRQNEK